MPIDIGDAVLRVRLDDRGLKKGFSGVGSILSKFTSVTKIAAAAVAIGAASLVAGLALAVKKAADFEQAIRNTAVVTGQTGDQLLDTEQKLRSLALTLGENTVFTANEAADALGILARKGFDVASFSVQDLQPFLDLAAATMTDLSFTTGIATSTLKAFGFANEEVLRIANVFVLAANTSALNMQTLGEAMKFVAPIAKSAGVSFEETTAALALLAEKGTVASIAGTGLRRAFVTLLAPQGKLLEILNSLGISTEDVSLKTNTFADVLETLKESGFTTANAMEAFGDRAGVIVEQLGEFGDGGKAEKAVTTFTTVLGKNRAALGQFEKVGDNIKILGLGIKIVFGDLSTAVDNSTGKLRDFTKTLEEVENDLAKETAKKQLETLKGSFKLLRSAIDTTAIKIGNVFLPSIDKLVNAATPLVKQLGKWVEGQEDLELTLLAWADVLIEVATPEIINFGREIGRVVANLNTIITFLAKATEAMFKFGEVSFNVLTRDIKQPELGAKGLLGKARKDLGLDKPIDLTALSPGLLDTMSSSLAFSPNSFTRAKDLFRSSIDSRASGGFTSGMALVGERGPELVKLPEGSQVLSNSDSRAISGGGTNNIEININMNGVSGSPQDIASAIVNRILQLQNDGQFNFGAQA